MLISAMLQASLSKIIDPNDPLFTIYPNTTAEAIQNFSNAIDTYAKLVTPVTTPVSQELSKAAFVNVMTPIIVSNSPTFMLHSLDFCTSLSNMRATYIVPRNPILRVIL